MYGIKTVIFLILFFLLAHTITAASTTKAIKFRRLWDGHKVSQENGMKALETGGAAIRDLNANGGADIALRDLINTGKLIGSRLFVSGSGFRSYKNQPGVTDPIAEAVKQVNARLDDGAGWIKVFGYTGGFDNNG